MPKVGGLIPDVFSAVSDKSRSTYAPGLRLLESELGHLEVGDVTLAQLQRLRDATHRRAGRERVESARRRGRRLRAYDPDAHGQGAAENFVRAARFFFNQALAHGVITASPAAGLSAPSRATAPERALTAVELSSIWDVATSTGRDPGLDGLVLTFLRHTGARREGCLNLALDHLDHRRLAVTLTEKRGKTRELPLRRSLLRDLESHARSRGAAGPGDAVFRFSSGAPMSRRRFNSLFDRVDRHLEWTEPIDVAAHWIRHTTLADIAAVSGVRVAAAYAGHADDSLGVIGRYTKVTWDDLVEAYEALFGECHDQ